MDDRGKSERAGDRAEAYRWAEARCREKLEVEVQLREKEKRWRREAKEKAEKEKKRTRISWSVIEGIMLAPAPFVYWYGEEEAQFGAFCGVVFLAIFFIVFERHFADELEEKYSVDP